MIHLGLDLGRSHKLATIGDFYVKELPSFNRHVNKHF